MRLNLNNPRVAGAALSWFLIVATLVVARPASSHPDGSYPRTFNLSFSGFSSQLQGELMYLRQTGGPDGACRGQTSFQK